MIRNRMIQTSLMLAGLVLTIGSVGCVSPCGMAGPGCNDIGCYDCDGTAGRPIPNGPLDGFNQFRRDLVCGGGGCGESYFGEWISTPPDAYDPCCGTDFVGGATACRPFCWQPGSLLSGLGMNLYGSRFCSGAESSTPCGCGDVGCGGCSGEYYEEGYSEGGYIEGGCSGGSCGGGGGCTSCASNVSSGTNRYSARMNSSISGRTQTGRSPSDAQMDARVRRIRR